MRRLLFFFVAGVAFISCDEKTGTKADMIIWGGTIYTVNPDDPIVEAVAVRSDTVLAVGRMAEIQKLKGENTQVFDLEGKTMTPGFIEGHGHFMGMGTTKLNVDLLGVTSYQETLELVAEAVAKSKPGEWIVGRGWHQSKWTDDYEAIRGFPLNKDLSGISPENPVFLKHASGHAAWVNKRALEVAGIGTNHVFTGGGEVILGKTGQPTGILNEKAQELVAGIIPAPTRNQLNQAFKLAVENCLENGITSFHDAGVDSTQLEIIRTNAEEGNLQVRLYVMISNRDMPLVNRWLAGEPQIGLANNHLTIRSIKIHADGALGSRGAWLLEEYSDMPGHYGHETTPMPEVYDIAKRGLAAGFQVNSHAIGDRTNQEILNMYEKAFNENPEAAQDHRFRIEHAQHINPNDIPRFSELNVLPSIQAIHMSSDRPWAIERLGKQRIEEGAYVWQKLIKSGARLINGTDVPVEPINPVACFYASVTRKTLEGKPPGGYEPNQKMTRQQALESYTINGAYGAFEENIKGSIEVGKLADFTIFDQDIMTVDENKLLNTQIAATIIGGKVLFKRD